MRKLICSAAVSAIIFAASVSFAQLAESDLAGGAVSAGTVSNSVSPGTTPSFWTLGFYSNAGHASASAGGQTAASFSANAIGDKSADTNGVAFATNGNASSLALNVENAWVNLGETSFAASQVSGNMSASAEATGKDTNHFLGIGPDFATATVTVVGSAGQNSYTFADANPTTAAMASQGQQVDILVDKTRTSYGFLSNTAAVDVNASDDFELEGASFSAARQTNTYAGVASNTWSEFESTPVGNNQTTIVGGGQVAGQAVLGAGYAEYTADYVFDGAVTKNASGNAGGVASVVTSGNGMTSSASSSSDVSQSN